MKLSAVGTTYNFAHKELEVAGVYSFFYQYVVSNRIKKMLKISRAFIAQPNGMIRKLYL